MMANATTARQVVTELFQDLEHFRLDDYRRLDDGGRALIALRADHATQISKAA